MSKRVKIASRVSHHAAPCPAFGATIRSARRAVSIPVVAARSVPGRKMCRQTGQDTANVDLFARQPLRVGYPERLPRQEIFLDGICRGRLTIISDGFCRDLAVPSPHVAAAGRITPAHGGPAPNADRAPSDPTHTDERHEWLARHTFVRWRICRLRGGLGRTSDRPATQPGKAQGRQGLSGMDNADTASRQSDTRATAPHETRQGAPWQHGPPSSGRRVLQAADPTSGQADPRQ